jgi:hypothetical protein
MSRKYQLDENITFWVELDAASSAALKQNTPTSKHPSKTLAITATVERESV